jgi:hypothetical protein
MKAITDSTTTFVTANAATLSREAVVNGLSLMVRQLLLFPCWSEPSRPELLLCSAFLPCWHPGKRLL